MGILDSLGLYKDPTKKAQKYLDQIPGTIKPYYDPYVQAGTDALPTLQEQYGQLIKDPSALIKAIMGSYQQSPGYQFSYDQAMKGAENAAAAGGYVGTPQDQLERARIGQGLASQDMNQYLQNVLGQYQLGLGGLGGIEQQGFGAGIDLATSLANILSGKANLAYEGAAGRNKMMSDILGGLLKAGGSAAGGAAMGGAGGAAGGGAAAAGAI